ncbi:hypothetical protein KA478_02370 [Patescibacteria group bacterium]|nr:hypothetical protein [Patescibacteria group bacterium]
MEDLQSLIDEETKKYNERYSTIKADLTQSIVKSQNAEVADIIKQFLDENTRFRSYINETIGNIQTTADQFKQKIEK